MKRMLLVIIFFMFQNYSNSQILSVNNETNEVEYSEVVEVKDVSKEELFYRALSWYAHFYVSSQDVIQFKSKEAGKIIGKGYLKVDYYSRNPKIYHTVSLFVKNGKFKYVISDFLYEDVQGRTFKINNFPKSWAGKKKFYKTISSQIDDMITDIKSFMNKGDDKW